LLLEVTKIEPTEAHIDIEGVRLSEGQSMAVRVAIEMYMFDLERELAKGMGQVGQNYLARLREVRRLISEGAI
jgi:hypothetical protein